MSSRHRRKAKHQTSRATARCKLCPLVARFDRGERRPERKWKRPGLFIASALIAALAAYVLAAKSGSFLPMYALWGALLLVGGFGIAISIFGCNACVARVFGDPKLQL